MSKCYLVSIDGCLSCEEDGSLHEESSSGDSRHRLFDQYRRSFCSVDSGCVPGAAYKKGLNYLEVGEPRLTVLASTETQRQFYQEAGIKTAIFMGCRNGEIELGLPTTTNINMQLDIRRIFSEEFLQQSPLGGTFLHDQNWSSSSSSSFRSVSVGSPDPEHSSLIMRKAYGRTRLPSPAADDATIARAMLAVISAPSSSSPVHHVSTSAHGPKLWSVARQVTGGGCRGGAFRRYNPYLALSVETRLLTHGQRMIKTANAILRQLSMRNPYARPNETRPTSNQLHHMISERKRREKLNESFAALRMLLPQGTKKDKSSILTRAKEYLNDLKAQIAVLEEKNRMMEAPLSSAPYEAGKEAANPGERVRIQVMRTAESSSETVRIQLMVIVWAECDTVGLVLSILERLREMGNICVLSLEANGSAPSTQMDPVRRAIFSLQIQGSEWDEGVFKEAVAEVVERALTPHKSPPPPPL